jgi:uncharacterized protein (DUF934 family)
MKLITTLSGYPELQKIDAIWSGYNEPLAAKGAELPANAASSLKIEADAGPEAFQPYLDAVGLILLHLPVFTDGRPYSLAAMLRQHYRYAGEIRVFGDVRREQLDHLHRCGITSFVLNQDEDAASALGQIGYFSKWYQPNISA